MSNENSEARAKPWNPIDYRSAAEQLIFQLRELSESDAELMIDGGRDADIGRALMELESTLKEWKTKAGIDALANVSTGIPNLMGQMELRDKLMIDYSKVSDAEKSAYRNATTPKGYAKYRKARAAKQEWEDKLVQFIE